MELEITEHARAAMEERNIPLEWVERTVAQPEREAPDPDDISVQRFYRKIPEFGDRVLRVVVKTGVEPRRLITVFFDRTMKGKL